MTDADPVTLEKIEDRLCRFFEQELQWDGDPAQLTSDSPLNLPSIVDSEELLELVTFVEDEYDIEIDDEELTADNFSTLPDVARLVVKKLSAEE
jgi:acyl carrier protein